eukprot:gene21349-biopygen10171
MCGTQGPGAGPKGPGAGPTRARRWLHKGPALAPQGPGAGPTRSAGAAWGELLRGGGVVTPAHFCPEQVLDEFPGEHAPRLLEAGCSGVECPSSLPQFCASRVHLCVYRCSRAGHESGFLREAGGHVWVGHKTSLNKRPNARIYSATLGPHGPQPHCYRNRMDHIYRLPLGVEFRTGDLCRDGRLVLNAPNVSISGQTMRFWCLEKRWPAPPDHLFWELGLLLEETAAATDWTRAGSFPLCPAHTAAARLAGGGAPRFAARRRTVVPRRLRRAPPPRRRRKWWWGGMRPRVGETAVGISGEITPSGGGRKIHSTVYPDAGGSGGRGVHPRGDISKKNTIGGAAWHLGVYPFWYRSPLPDAATTSESTARSRHPSQTHPHSDTGRNETQSRAAAAAATAAAATGAVAALPPAEAAVAVVATAAAAAAAAAAATAAATAASAAVAAAAAAAADNTNLSYRVWTATRK